MSKWFVEWVLISLIVCVGVGTGLSLWTVWPELSNRLSNTLSDSLTVEGVAALTLLAIVTVGFLKLVFQGESRRVAAS